LSVAVTDASETAFGVRRVVSGLNQPAFLAPVPDGTGRVFVTELAGRIVVLTPSTGAIATNPFPRSERSALARWRTGPAGIRDFA
jgi:hypothetical protein